MRKLFTIITFIVAGKVALGQEQKKDTQTPTSQVISRLSYSWKLDSLAGNGFRRNSVKELFNSSLDNVSETFLLDNLGKPNQLRKTNYGTEYVYYYFNIKAMPKGYDAPAACAYIAFQFKTNEKYVSEMVEGDIDR